MFPFFREYKNKLCAVIDNNKQCLLILATTIINYIPTDRYNNFKIIKGTSTQNIPYDFDSIMHYDAYAFTNNREPTIQPLNSTIPLSRIGQRSTLSDQDIRHIEALYCEGMCGVCVCSVCVCVQCVCSVCVCGVCVQCVCVECVCVWSVCVCVECVCHVCVRVCV